MCLQAPTLLSGEEAKKDEEMYLGPALKFDDAELESLRAEVANIGQVIEGKVVWAQSASTIMNLAVPGIPQFMFVKAVNSAAQFCVYWCFFRSVFLNV